MRSIPHNGHLSGEGTLATESLQPILHLHASVFLLDAAFPNVVFMEVRTSRLLVVNIYDRVLNFTSRNF